MSDFEPQPQPAPEIDPDALPPVPGDPFSWRIQQYAYITGSALIIPSILR